MRTSSSQSRAMSFQVVFVFITLLWQSHARLGDKTLHTCKVSLVKDVFYEPHRNRRVFFQCKSPEKTIFLDFEPSDEIVKAHWDLLSREKWFIRFRSSFIRDQHLVLPQGQQVETIQVEKKRPWVQSHNGTKPIETAAIVRIAAKDTRCSMSRNKMLEIAFGTERVSARSQFEACSGGEFHFDPTAHPIIDVHLPEDLSYYSRKTIRPEAQKLVCKHLGLKEDCEPSKASGIDHFMYVVPKGLKDGNDIGWMVGSVGGNAVVFQEPSFAVESILHEVSHNWLLGHSRESLPSNPDNDNKENPEYGDDTGMMGSSFYLWGERNGDLRCFNGMNYYQLGWFPHKRIELKAFESRLMNLVGIADFHEMTEKDFIAIKVGEYYLTYNRKKGPNASTIEHADKVLVVKKVPDQNIDNYYDSDLRAVMSVGESFQEGELQVSICGTTEESHSTVHISIGPENLCDQGSTH